MVAKESMKRYLKHINPLTRLRDAEIFNRVHSSREFASILHRERDRADRTGQEFSMAVFAVGNGGKKTAAARNLVPILTHRIRSTDAIGWLADGRIGSVLPHTRPECAWKFVANVRKAYNGSASPGVRGVHLSVLVASGRRREPTPGSSLPQENTLAGGDRRFRDDVLPR